MWNPKVFEMYPRSAALGLRFVGLGEHDHEGFDSGDVATALGDEKHEALKAEIAQTSSMFVCGHRNYPEGHNWAGSEVHCYYAKDVEAFLCRV